MKQNPFVYDVASHNLTDLFGIKTIRIKGEIDAQFDKIETISPPQAKIDTVGHFQSTYLIDYRNEQAIKAVQRMFGRSKKICWISKPFSIGDDVFPPGSIYIETSESDYMQEIVRKLSLKVAIGIDPTNMPAYQIEKPRVGIYQSHLAATDEGWTRFVLDEFDIEYSTIKSDEFTEDLKRFSAIILPHQTSAQIIHGFESGAAPQQYSGGIGQAGVGQLDNFVKNGGTLIALGDATEMPLKHFWLKIKDVTRDLSHQEYYIPGSLLKAIVNNTEPIGYGMPENIAVFNYNSPAFELIEGVSIADYPGENLTLSGWAKGEDKIALKSIVADIPYGNGSVILIGNRTQFRAQTRSTFKFLINAIIKSSSQKVTLD
jgi:hypothetical protein